MSTMKGFSLCYIPPEKLMDNTSISGEKYDIFALGLTLLQDYLSLAQKDIFGLNDPENNGKQKVQSYLNQINDMEVRKILTGMLEFDPSKRSGYHDVLESINKL